MCNYHTSSIEEFLGPEYQAEHADIDGEGRRFHCVGPNFCHCHFTPLHRETGGTLSVSSVEAAPGRSSVTSRPDVARSISFALIQ
jgi:hypothetical protein